jgi:hypothetical protein
MRVSGSPSRGSPIAPLTGNETGAFVSLAATVDGGTGDICGGFAAAFGGLMGATEADFELDTEGFVDAASSASSPGNRLWLFRALMQMLSNSRAG